MIRNKSVYVRDIEVVDIVRCGILVLWGRFLARGVHVTSLAVSPHVFQRVAAEHSNEFTPKPLVVGSSSDPVH